MQTNRTWSNQLLPLGDLYALFNDLGMTILNRKDLVDYRTDSIYTTYSQIIASVDFLIEISLIEYSEEVFKKLISITSKTNFDDNLRDVILQDNSKLIATLFSNDDLYFHPRLSTYSIPFNNIPLQYNGLIFLLDELGVLHYDKSTGTIFIQSNSIVDSVKALKKENHEILKRGSITLLQLKEGLAIKDALGREAEQHALAFERKNLIHNGIALHPELISDLDASKGYDMVSYSSTTSTAFDKFIEVKSCKDSSYHFFISQNELSAARELKESYFLYLYDRSSGNFHILQDPYPLLMDRGDWITAPSVYSVHRLG